MFKIPATDIIFVFFQHLHTLQDLRLAFRLMFACVLCLFACVCPIYVSCLSVYLIRTITQDKLILLASNHLPCLSMLPLFQFGSFFCCLCLLLLLSAALVCMCVCVCVFWLAMCVSLSVSQSIPLPLFFTVCLSDPILISGEHPSYQTLP